MLAIARALMLRPRLLLLDEPSFGLAPMLVKAVFENLRQVNETEQVCMLIVEQKRDTGAGTGKSCLFAGNW